MVEAQWSRAFGSQCSAKRSHARRKMKYWEIIADNLSKAGWSMGYVSAIDSNGRTIWIADAHCGDGKRFVVHADEKLTAIIKVESECALATALLGTRWRKSLVEVMRAKPQPPGPSYLGEWYRWK